jgi:hypothetical protein
LAGTRKSKGSDVVFEGVLIPKGTRSARLAEQGITNEDEMGNFLTAVFADTLNGKITLPKPTSGVDVPARVRNGVDQKLRRGLPIGIQGKGSVKRTRESKVQQSEEEA